MELVRFKPRVLDQMRAVGASKNTPNTLPSFRRPEAVEAIRRTPLQCSFRRRAVSIVEATVARVGMCQLAREPPGRMVYFLFHGGSLWVHGTHRSAIVSD